MSALVKRKTSMISTLKLVLKFYITSERMIMVIGQARLGAARIVLGQFDTLLCDLTVESRGGLVSDPLTAFKLYATES